MFDLVCSLLAIAVDIFMLYFIGKVAWEAFVWYKQTKESNGDSSSRV